MCFKAIQFFKTYKKLQNDICNICEKFSLQKSGISHIQNSKLTVKKVPDLNKLYYLTIITNYRQDKLFKLID